MGNAAYLLACNYYYDEQLYIETLVDYIKNNIMPLLKVPVLLEHFENVLNDRYL